MPRPAITRCRGIYSASRETRGRDSLGPGGATRTELRWQPLEFRAIHAPRDAAVLCISGYAFANPLGTPAHA
jgi:hypothetical protein